MTRMENDLADLDFAAQVNLHPLLRVGLADNVAVIAEGGMLVLGRGLGQQLVDPLFNSKIQWFDFATIANAFDAAGRVDNWSLSNVLLDSYLGGSDSAAYGGDIAYRYGLDGDLSGISNEQIHAVINDASFGSAVQSIEAAAVAASFSLASGESDAQPVSDPVQPLAQSAEAPALPTAIHEPQPTLNPAPAVSAKYDAPAVDEVIAAAASASSNASSQAAQAASALAAAWLSQSGPNFVFDASTQSSPPGTDPRTTSSESAEARDDAAWLKRYWAAVQRWLDSDLGAADDLGAPEGFSPARVGLPAPRAYGGAGAARSASNMALSSGPMEEFRGLSEGFNRLG